MKMRRVATNRPRVEELEGRLLLSAVSSWNWSGYAVTTNPGAVSAVSGSWVVPAASGAGTGYSSDWVGIDGFGSSSVEQIGTEQDVINGRTQYYAWYEMYPSGAVAIPMAVHPGDTVSAAVTYGSGAFTLTITDTPVGGVAQTFTTTQADPGAARSSAEWVVEAPSSSYGILPLANFGTVSFTGARATINGATGSIGDPAWQSAQVQQINMVSQRSGATESATSALDPSGTTFSVNYVSPVAVNTSRPHERHSWWWAWWRQPDVTATQPAATSPEGTSTASTATAPASTLTTHSPFAAVLPTALAASPAITPPATPAAPAVRAVTSAQLTAVGWSGLGSPGRLADGSIGVDRAEGAQTTVVGAVATAAPTESLSSALDSWSAPLPGAAADRQQVEGASPAGENGSPAAPEEGARGTTHLGEGTALQAVLGMTLGLALAGAWGGGADEGLGENSWHRPAPWLALALLLQLRGARR
jgi:hypothetical protein